MHDLPASFAALAALVFGLGVKHGFDADHLAAIDGLTRLNAAAGQRFARWCGTLFSLGHGAVVTLVVLGIVITQARSGRAFEIPAWFDAAGVVVSLSFLLLLGVANLRVLFATPLQQVVRPVGVKGRLLRRALQSRCPLGVAGVGALFALSFDTLSLAALFAVAGARSGGAGPAAWLALLFLLGMLVTDGVNGLWISRLIARADRLAAVASRLMSLAVASVSLGMAAFGTARHVSPWFDHWAEPQDSWFGAIVITIIAGSYSLAYVLSKRHTTVLA